MRERAQRQRHRPNRVTSRRAADVAVQPRAQFSIPLDREQPPYLRDRLELFRQLGFELGGKIRRSQRVASVASNSSMENFFSFASMDEVPRCTRERRGLGNP
jgi:hypothetical protein